jgi:hypothetical protein
MPLGSDKSHAPGGHNVYKMTDVTPPPISMCDEIPTMNYNLAKPFAVTAVTAANATGIKPVTSTFKSLDIREKRTER